MILIIDNYDSFTYNVYQLVCQVTAEEVVVKRNDAITVEEAAAMKPSSIILSPGPGRPEGAGISLEVVKKLGGEIPILGVCLGHQTIIQAFGGNIVHARRIVHGKTEPVAHDGKGLFRGIPSPFKATRYHSLAGERASLPDELIVTATTPDGEIMGVRHKSLCIEGVQFHPESIGSEQGKRIFTNFFRYKRNAFNRKQALEKLLAGGSLSEQEAYDFMDELTEGELPDVVIAAILTAMNTRPFTVEELTGCAKVLKKKKVAVSLPFATLDTCGTGGDDAGTYNISSLSALIAASAGARVAKHGNRAVSSKSGSADFYTSLGIPLAKNPEQAAEQIQTTGFTFLFAPAFHSAMRHAGPVRAQLGIKTLMNLLGPLVNPAEAEYQIIGVYTESVMAVVARTAHTLGVKRVLVVHSEDGLDEISPAAATKLFFIDEGGAEQEFAIHPEQFGITDITSTDLAGGSCEENAIAARKILDCRDHVTILERGERAFLDAAALNAAAALWVSCKVPTIEDGYKKAVEAVLKGKTAELTATLKKFQ